MEEFNAVEFEESGSEYGYSLSIRYKENRVVLEGRKEMFEMRINLN